MWNQSHTSYSHYVLTLNAQLPNPERNLLVHKSYGWAAKHSGLWSLKIPNIWFQKWKPVTYTFGGLWVSRLYLCELMVPGSKANSTRALCPTLKFIARGVRCKWKWEEYIFLPGGISHKHTQKKSQRPTQTLPGGDLMRHVPNRPEPMQTPPENNWKTASGCWSVYSIKFSLFEYIPISQVTNLPQRAL